MDSTLVTAVGRHYIELIHRLEKAYETLEQSKDKHLQEIDHLEKANKELEEEIKGLYNQLKLNKDAKKT